ncbi:hypothetical protein [Sandaracinus amylolyticus]|uniref:hypothetical protein n=1 Tax=Sandaracinus amylolyticus TaxID=927083 RepID=UPI001F29DF2E|nr:hypothetical protein [Sandaracinus amylolyticus]UJR79029.1 Hypothetical protein I5071_10620 [Sandaracinus amylolyticus]
MASKQVIDRERSSRTVVATLERYAPEAGQGVRAASSELLGRREVMPDIELVIRIAARALERSTSELIDADRAHDREINGDSHAREERDRAHRAVYELVISVRGLVQASFGDVALKTLGLWDPSPPDPQGTLTYARNLADVLGDTAVALPAPRIEHVRFDREGLAMDLVTKVDVLRTAMALVAREESAAKGTQARKDAAMAAYDRTFRIAANLGVALFQLGGLDELADRIKPSPRRPGMLDQPGEPGGEEPGAPSSDAA